LLNSFGHPVPVVNGQLQKTGRNAEGKVIKREFSDDVDTFLLDIAPAYQLKELQKLTRNFTFQRGMARKEISTEIRIIDSVKLESPGTLETALVTYGSWEKVAKKTGHPAPRHYSILTTTGSDDENGCIELNLDTVLVVVTATSEGKPVPLEFSTVEIDEDSMAKKKPTRFGFKIAQPITEAQVLTLIVPNVKL
jgi:hypothetical protein